MGTTPSTSDDRKRVLVIANETCPNLELCACVRERAGSDSEVLVVAPALNTRLRHYVSDDEAARVHAEERLAQSVTNLAALGLHPTGEVGDADPILAIQDALVSFPADEVVIATHPADRSNWLERDVIEKARTRFDLPITHIVIDAEPEAGSTFEG